MPDPVKPALTAEEWSRPHTTLGDNPKLGIFGRAEVRDRDERDNVSLEDATVLAIRPPRTLDERGIVCGADQRHALAALALHDQPFGFDREDISVLECASSFWPVGREWEAEVAKLRSIMARIAALLPPRGTEP